MRMMARTQMMKTSLLAMIVGIIPFETQIQVAPVAVHNLSVMKMIGMTHPRHLLEARVAPQVAAQVAAAPQVEAPAVVPVAPQEALRVAPAAAHLEVHLVAQVAAVHPVVVVHPVAAPLVAVPVVALQVAVPVAPPRRERAHHADYSRIQTPNPASRHPMVSSTLRAFSSNFVCNDVPEIVSATSTYHPPSVHIAMHATNARSPQVKSG